MAAAGGSSTAQTAPEPAPLPQAEDSSNGPSEAAKLQAKAAEQTRSPDKKGKGSWLQRIIRREGPKSAAEGNEGAAGEGSASPLAPAPLYAHPRKFAGGAELDLKPEPIDSVKTEESAVELEPLDSGEETLEEVARSESQAKPKPQPKPVALRAGVTASVVRPKTVGRQPAQEPPGKRVPKVVAKQASQQATGPQTAAGSEVASSPLPEPSTGSKQPFGIKPAVAPPLARPQTAERAPSLASLPKPKTKTVKSGSFASLPKPKTVKEPPAAVLPKPSTGPGAAQGLPKPKTTAVGKVASPAPPQLAQSVTLPSLAQPVSDKSSEAGSLPSAAAKAPRLPKPKTAEPSIVSPALPLPSSIPRPGDAPAEAAAETEAEGEERASVAAAAEMMTEGSPGASRPRSVFDTTAEHPAEKKASSVADWFNRPPAEEAEDPPLSAKKKKPTGAGWFARRPMEEGAEEESGSRELRSPGQGRSSELDLPSPAGISTRPGGWDTAPKGAADFFGMKRPVLSNDDADVFTSHGAPRGWDPERQTFDNPRSSVSKKTEEDMITRFREMGRQARSLAGNASQSRTERIERTERAERAEPRRGFSGGGNETSPAVAVAAVHFEKGLACLRRADYQGALREWEQALSVDPENRVYQSNMKRLRDLIASMDT